MLAGNRRMFTRSYASAEKPLFDKILVANRGEIACRIMRTCQKMGIKTVAVFSEPDATAPHTSMADEAIYVGPAASTQSYLKVENILEAVKISGAQAVHPGYGFLSEKDYFVQALDEMGVTFIGPPRNAMHAMGDKIESKKIAKNAGVNTIPGFLGEVDNDDQVLKIAHEIGYPVMIKAAAGGGGKGMRIAWNDKEALEGFRLSRAEAKSSFNDDRMLIEKFIETPRHIEIQVLADGQGNTVYLNERECSIQRRNQKVIEEAPSPFLDPTTRKMMGQQAVMLANAVGYRSAGTVEMLVDAKKNFYFLEMNTRLQVEHPITEYITGVDIVEQMIRIAAGQKLSYRQEDIPLKGWAVESRVYAEDPYRNFLPSIGKLQMYEPPIPEDEAQREFVRVDDGVTTGSVISPYYDPMISKLVTYGSNREEAINRMAVALDAYVIRGVEHNVSFLRDVLENKRFREGRLSTNFIPEEYPKGFHGHVLKPKEKNQLLAAALTLEFLVTDHKFQLTQQLGQRPALEGLDRVLTFNEQPIQGNVQIAHDNEGDYFEVILGDNTKVNVVTKWDYGDPYIQMIVDEDPVTIQIIEQNWKGFVLQHFGTKYEVGVGTLFQKHMESYMPEKVDTDYSNFIKSPMPGKIVSVQIKPGDKVNLNQEVAVVEAMKMQNLIRADKDGVIKAVYVKPGQDVAVDELLIEYEPSVNVLEDEKK